MNTLHELPNISRVIEQKLIEVGINTPYELKIIGSKEAFTKLKLKDNMSCLNMLFALEGAIQGIRWHYLPENLKHELKEFYKTI